MPANTGSHNQKAPLTLEPRRLRTNSQLTQQTDPDNTLVKTPMEALEFLLARNLIPECQPTMLNNLATALLHIAEAQKIPRTLEEAIHSISILLTDLSNSTLVSEISTTIS